MAENNIVTFRTTDLERSMLDYLISKGHKQSDVIKAGIQEVYRQEVLAERPIPVVGTIKDGVVDWAAENDK
jgi:hypothetical protein